MKAVADAVRDVMTHLWPVGQLGGIDVRDTGKIRDRGKPGWVPRGTLRRVSEPVARMPGRAVRLVSRCAF